MTAATGMGRSVSFVLDAIGRGIVSGYYSDDQVPGEVQFARRYGVSRQLMREALKMLSAKGMITTRQRAGISVLARAHWNHLD